MIKELLYYLSHGQWRKAKIYFQAHVIYNKMKLIRWANRVWLRIWPIFFIVPVTLMLIGAFLQVKHDYSLIHNYINLDAFNEGIYINWRTDGSPGQEPPK